MFGPSSVPERGINGFQKCRKGDDMKKRLNEPVIKKKTEDEGTSLTTAGSVYEDVSHPGGPS